MAPGLVDLRQYLAIFKRQRWLILLVTIAIAGLAAAYSFTRTPIYTAKAKLLVRPTGVNLTETAQFGEAKLISLPTEAELVTSTAVAEIAGEILGSDDPPLVLLKRVSVNIPTDSLVLEISYSDPSPATAQKGALGFARGYIQFRQTQAVTDVQRETEDITSQILGFRAKIRGLDSGAQTERQQLLAQILLLRTSLSQLAGVNTSPGEVFSDPTLPTHPSSPKNELNIALGLVAGLGLGLGLALLRSRTDVRVRERDQLEEAMGAPVLAVIPRIQDWTNRAAAKLATLQEPRGPAAEAYRTLRPTLLAAAAQRNVKTIMVVSPTAGEGKTTTAANLGVVLAQAGKTVALISADLRKPRLHEFFGLENESGLTEVLAGETQLWESLKKSGVENLWILPSGNLPDQPAELLQSSAMEELIDEQRRVVDFVILDCPPVLVVSDSLELVPHADAVLVVADAARTSKDAVSRTRDQLLQMGATIIGAVLNDFDTAAHAMYYGYGYSYGYGPDGSKGSAPPSSNGKVGWRSRRRDRNRA